MNIKSFTFIKLHNKYYTINSTKDKYPIRGEWIKYRSIDMNIINNKVLYNEYLKRIE